MICYDIIYDIGGCDRVLIKTVVITHVVPLIMFHWCLHLFLSIIENYFMPNEEFNLLIIKRHTLQ